MYGFELISPFKLIYLPFVFIYVGKIGYSLMQLMLLLFYDPAYMPRTHVGSFYVNILELWIPESESPEQTAYLPNFSWLLSTWSVFLWGGSVPWH